MVSNFSYVVSGRLRKRLKQVLTISHQIQSPSHGFRHDLSDLFCKLFALSVKIYLASHTSYVFLVPTMRCFVFSGIALGCRISAAALVLACSFAHRVVFFRNHGIGRPYPVKGSLFYRNARLTTGCWPHMRWRPEKSQNWTVVVTFFVS